MAQGDSAFFLMILSGAALAACVMSVIGTIWVLAAQRSGRRVLESSAKEVFGTMKKIEGLTAGKREQILREYDKIVQDLRLRLPSVISAQASDRIFEMEKRLLQRLAEIDPSIRDERNKAKLDDLIRDMESLQDTIVQGVCETVQKSLADARREIACDDTTVV